ncbi:MAG: carbohydrate ABC transporter permease [Geminicoccaceae bacterium]|nr:carbohydrate ABC transporter permease [Geminicoccaceae bacterium]
MEARRRRPGETSIGWALSSLAAVMVALIFFFPLYWGLSTSLRNPMDTFTTAGLGIPWLNFEPTLDNWRDQLSNRETQAALVNSTFISTFATFLALFIGIPASYALARFHFAWPSNRDLTIFFFMQRVLPPVATVIPFYLMMRFVGLLDTYSALILVNTTFILPFVIIILRQAFLDMPRELEEAALVDGAGYVGAFWRIALPLAAPAAAAAGLIIYGRVWNEFLFAIAIGSRDAITVPVHLGASNTTRGVQFWFMAVRQMAAIVPPVILALLAQRYIVRGLTMGATKG